MDILTIKQAQATIKLIVSGGKKLDERIHQVGVSGLAHYKEHGDTSTLTALADAMPKSSRGNALKYWITKNANVKWDKKAFNGKGGFVKAKKGEECIANVIEASESPFWEKTDTEQSVFDAKKAVSAFHAFVKKCKNAIEDGSINVDDLPEDVRTAIAA